MRCHSPCRRTVGDKLFDARDQADSVFGHHAIGGIVGGENGYPGSAKGVDTNTAVLELHATMIIKGR
jgi:hypothetical protein